MIHKQNHKLDITNRLVHSITEWKTLSTDKIDFIPGREIGIVFMYGVPLAKVEEVARCHVHSINVNALDRCSKSRFFIRERLQVPIIKDKKGLHLEVHTENFRNGTDILVDDELKPQEILTLPTTTLWTVIKGLSLPFSYKKIKFYDVPYQLELFEGKDYRDIFEKPSDEAIFVNEPTLRAYRSPVPNLRSTFSNTTNRTTAGTVYSPREYSRLYEAYTTNDIRIDIAADNITIDTAAGTIDAQILNLLSETGRRDYIDRVLPAREADRARRGLPIADLTNMV